MAGKTAGERLRALITNFAALPAAVRAIIEGCDEFAMHRDETTLYERLLDGPLAAVASLTADYTYGGPREYGAPPPKTVVGITVRSCWVKDRGQNINLMVETPKRMTDRHSDRLDFDGPLYPVPRFARKGLSATLRALEAEGRTEHGKDASTLGAVLRFCEKHRLAYRLTAQPGVGYTVELIKAEQEAQG